MMPCSQIPGIRPHVLTVLESRRSMLQRCAGRALADNRLDAALKWNNEALEVEAVIGMVHQVMTKRAAA